MKEITESNRLIAEFHGWKHSPTPKNKGIGYWNFPEWSKAAFNPDYFAYHKDWEWLMEVVDKIEENGAVTIIKNGCIIETLNHEITVSGETTLIAVYRAVVQFIQWYNTHNKK